MEWTKTKSELKFNPVKKNFQILHNCIYWAYLGCNIGAEEGKRRPVIVTRTYLNSPIVSIIPLTTKRLNDGKEYHIDLENEKSTALVEQMRIIDVSRIDRPMRKKGLIVSITIVDIQKINEQIIREYLLSTKLHSKKEK